MEWQLVLVLFFSGLILLMLLGMPIFVAFMILNAIGMVYFFGAGGWEQFVLSINSSLTSFVLLPIPLFILLGEVMFRSGVANRVIDVLDQWLGRIPGRLSLLTVLAGTAFSTLTGTSTASTAVLGTTLVPEMEKRGYKKEMCLGPVLGSGGIAIMVPPSSLAIVLGAIAEVSIARLLLAIIVPGFLLGLFYTLYILVRCMLNPSLAPTYVVTRIPLAQKLMDTVKYILPLGIIIFLVVGVIFIGVATPTEAAASGTLGAFLLALAYRKLNWSIVKESVLNTLKYSGMILIIISASTAFSQILAFSGAARGLVGFAAELPLAPILVIAAMQVVVLLMGGFMSLIAIMMITIPIFMPVVIALGFNPIWFAVIFLLNIEMALTTPPLGMNLYVMKGVVSGDTTMTDIILAAIPYLVVDLFVMILLLAFPILALWLPGLL